MDLKSGVKLSFQHGLLFNIHWNYLFYNGEKKSDVSYRQLSISDCLENGDIPSVYEKPACINFKEGSAVKKKI